MSQERTDIFALKLQKMKLKSAFTKAKNKLLNAIVDEEDINIDEVKARQEDFDRTPEEVLVIFESLSVAYKQVKDDENVAKIESEMETNETEYSRTYNVVQEACRRAVGAGDEEETPKEPEKTLGTDMWRQMKRVTIPVFNGDKTKYHSWQAAFSACIDNAPATAEYKLLQLRNYLSGEAFKCIENLGHSASAYKAAKERLERKYGGEQRQVAMFLEELESFHPFKEENCKTLENFADLLDIAVINLKEHEKELDLGDGALYIRLQKKMPELMLTRYNRWVFENGKTESVELLREWIIMEAHFHTRANETVHGLSQYGKKKERVYFVKDSEKQETNKCRMCHGNHRIWECKNFRALPVRERWEKAKSIHLCFRCLADDHVGTNCSRGRKCNIGGCVKLHNRLLHSDFEGKVNHTEKSEKNQASGTFMSNAETLHCQYESPKLALRTVPVILQAGKRKLVVNALLDDGSTKSYLNADIAAELQLDKSAKTEKITVNVLCGRSESFESKPVTVGIESLNGQVKKNIEVQTIKNVTGNLPAVDWNTYSHQYPHLKEIDYPHVAGDKTVDIMIGIDYPEMHMSLHEICGKPGEPIARLTPLGWTCVGPTKTTENVSLYTFFLRDGDSSESLDLNRTLKEFWEIEHESVSHKSDLTIEEQEVFRKSEESMEFKDNRYEVGIPWKECCVKLPDNKNMALKRLENTEQRLKRNPELKKSYSNIIEGYVDKEYVEKVYEDNSGAHGQWYLPHFPVLRPDKDTTKVRIVFDASAKQDDVSLNDTIHQGPKLQRDLFDVLLRFRKYPVALVCDIAEMYLQIGLKAQDKPFHRFLWRAEPDKPPDTYQFNRLVFGVNCSPFLAQLVSQKHANILVNDYPTAADTVLKSTYMDDSMDSVPDAQQGIELYNQLSNLWKEAGMHARKWLSNDPDVLKEIPPEDRAKEVNLETANMPAIKTLGVWWSSAEDTFNVKVSENKEETILTKRKLLSKIATVFDPIGMVAPVVVRGKMLLQEIWMSGLDWDDPLNTELEEKAKQWLLDLSELKNVVLERSLEFMEGASSELHTFVDASSDAYGAVAYVRHVMSNSEVSVKFVTAKTRVAPLKSTSIPRLELVAAVLGLKLTEQVCRTLNIPVSNVTFWSDSMNVLWWVRAKSRDFKPFIANRIGSIQEMTEPQQWRYIPTKMNPADVLSRGTSANKLVTNHEWLNGPEYLQTGQSAWPENKFQQHDNAKCEMKVKSRDRNNENISFHCSEAQNDRLSPENYSSWSHLVRVYAWVNRFLENCQLQRQKRNLNRELIAGEIQNAEYRLIRSPQMEEFEKEYQCLLKGKELPKSSRLLTLNPKLDEEGVVRSDSRLKYVDYLPYDSKYPIILPRKSPVTKLIVRHYHELGNHCGTNQTLAKLSAHYWLISGREEIRDTENECTECRRRKQRTNHQIMGPIPELRIGKSLRAFNQTAVDYAGPFQTKQGRGKPRNKRYLCLFTCMTCRAVHLELSFAMDTDAFLNAFYRFVSRRGLPEKIVSDNGTNFVGAVHELKDLYNKLDKDKITRKGANHGVQWHFIPPGAPHFGGVHEAMIKSANCAIYAILGNADITDEELLTAVTGAESLINSRPLTFQSANPSDECVLTPNHFLHGQLGGEFAPETVDSTPFSYRKR